MEWLAVNHIKDFGQACTINGTTPSFCILRNIGTRTDLKYVESFREGLILADSNFASGDILEVGSDKFIGITAKIDQATGQIHCQVVKTNTSLTIQRYEKTYDDYGNVTGEAWNDIVTDVPAYAGTEFQRLQLEDPGLVQNKIMQVIIQGSNDVQSLDRLIFAGENWQVDNIDVLTSPGNKVLDVSKDTRV